VALLTFRLKRKHPIWLFDGGKAAPVCRCREDQGKQKHITRRLSFFHYLATDEPFALHTSFNRQVYITIF
jgi:hypothetical protein